ncbi:hypothetical protein Q75_02915 [Bacillus coahuilensis p1.1.43]|uniref:Uncharacterized protein n=1 Tax=Bacillus coahuilensis p1.1.43 TaxID=1150625 RepID=A0A147KBC0_9BACI|nr:hypothetical protein [Bacillus coahuilensis]KUP08431.1 hypothetical protein Q75_02915 [Bacillus coahuilensis p1.1.43]
MGIQTFEMKVKHISSILRRLNKEVSGYTNGYNHNLKERLQWWKEITMRDYYYVFVEFNNDTNDFHITFAVNEVDQRLADSFYKNGIK